LVIETLIANNLVSFSFGAFEKMAEFLLAATFCYKEMDVWTAREMIRLTTANVQASHGR